MNQPVPPAVPEIRFVPGHEPQVSYAAMLLIECKDLLESRGRSAWRRRVETLTRASGKSPDGEATLRVLDNGVEYACRTYAAVFYWSHFERIVLHNRQIIFAEDEWSTGGFRAFGAPIDAFATPERAVEFYDAALRAHNASGSGEVDRIKEVTHRFALPCPRCKYSLAALEDRRCPECGLTITITMLRLALAFNKAAQR